ncbi:icarapin-like [Belonocnema kinseyi]|uniref:icarapin-like n=1 Tax=Belonocnema kinseyi TaxID=2817044 RepID=UPI00143DFA80|nr:icarapin-like [Belonocnema kinseyi]
MENFRVLFVATLFILNAYAAPRVAPDSAESSEASDKKNTDTVLVLPGRGNVFSSSVFDLPAEEEFEDDGLEGFPGSSYFPFRSNVFDGFFSSMQNAMNRLREQMAGVLAGQIGQGIGPWGNIPEGANTTSTTKIIDGHVVTINETTYTDGDENSGAIFRVRVIDVKPQNETLEIEGNPEAKPVIPSGPKKDVENTTPARSVETVEDLENEIPKNQVDTLTA